MLAYHIWATHQAHCAPLCVRLGDDFRACHAAGFARPYKAPSRGDGEAEWSYGMAKYLAPGINDYERAGAPSTSS